MTFDTLSFSKRLHAAGVPLEQAEAHAQAQAEFLTDHLLFHVAGKEDLKAFATREDLKAFATKEDLKAFVTKEDLRAVREEMQHLETRLRMEMQLLGKTLTVRLGGIVVLGIGALGALVQF